MPTKQRAISMQWQPEVHDGAATGEPVVPEPGRVRARVRLARADPGHVPDGAVLDGLHRLQRLGGVHEVLEVAAEDAGLLDRVEHALRLAGVATQGLGDEHGLAGLGDGSDGFLVQEVRQGDDHDVRIGVPDGGLHIGRRLGHVMARREGLASSCGAGVDHADAVTTALPVQGQRVEVADEPGAEHGHVVLLHSHPPRRSAPRSYRPAASVASRVSGLRGQVFESTGWTVWTVPAVGRNVVSWPSSQATR